MLETEVNDEFCVIDFKASSKPYPEHHIQCAAYAKAIELLYDREVECTYILRLDKKTCKWQLTRSDADRRVLCGLSRCKSLTTQSKRRASSWQT